MTRKPLLLALFSCVLAASEARADGGSAWVSGGSMRPLEQRVAVAAGPLRTTVWTSLRFEASAGPVAVVVPVPDGAALDTSSDAWFEALEEATAPRVLPPAGQSGSCPGASGAKALFEVEGDPSHVPTLAPADAALLDDVAALTAWGAASGLALAPQTAAQLATFGGRHFLAVRFLAPGGVAVTRTLRVVLPAGPALLPLALTRSGAGDLFVTAWLVGEGTGHLAGSSSAWVPDAALRWEAHAKTSDYRDLVAGFLSAEEPSGALLEGSSHAVWSQSVPVVAGTTVGSAALSYFERAAAYDASVGDPAPCLGRVDLAMASVAPVAASCPRGDLGVVGTSPACVESPGPGTLDPALFRCSRAADDLAVAFSGLVPAATVLTRQTLLLEPGKAGSDWPLSFAPGAPMTPIRHAGGVDLGGCPGLGSGAGGSGSSGPGTSQGSQGSSNQGGPSSDGDADDPGGDPSATDEGDLSASLDGTDPSTPSTSSGCSSSTPPADPSSTDTSGSCSGSSDPSSSGGSCDCGGASGGDVGSSGCSGGDVGSGCSGGSGLGDVSCAVHARARRTTRGSILAMLVLALVAPLRRRGSRVTRARRGRGPAGLTRAGGPPRRGPCPPR